MILLVLVGESGCGKSSVEKYLENYFGLHRIISYTTREPRKNELDGRDYNFITELQFKELKDEGFFAEIATYNGWYYGSAKRDYTDKFYQDRVIVLTPHGIRQVKNKGIEIFTVYISIPRRDRLVKILQRGDNIEESYRRSLSDVGQFDGIEDEVDLMIKNDGYKKSIKDIASIIYYGYQSMRKVSSFDCSEK